MEDKREEKGKESSPGEQGKNINITSTEGTSFGPRVTGTTESITGHYVQFKKDGEKWSSEKTSKKVGVKILSGKKRKTESDSDGPKEKKGKSEKKAEKATIYNNFAKVTLSEYKLRELDYPRPDPSGTEGQVILCGDHFGFTKGRCKRCNKMFDTTFSTTTRCDFHLERSKRFSGRQQPHGCCGRRFGSTGCRTAPSHVYKGNLYLDLKGYKKTEKKTDQDYKIYAVDTESIHTKKGLEVCRVTVVDEGLRVVHNEFCLPTSDVVDYNTTWSGITEQSLKGVTKTFQELREDMLNLFYEDTILIGHGLSHDLISMKIIHNKVIDTLVLYPHHRGWPLKRSLKDIALTELGMRIQDGEGHDSQEDAIVAMKLALRRVSPLLNK